MANMKMLVKENSNVSSDEFFDAVDDENELISPLKRQLDDDGGDGGYGDDGKGGTCDDDSKDDDGYFAQHSLDESATGECVEYGEDSSVTSSQHPSHRLQGQEKKELWASARSFLKEERQENGDETMLGLLIDDDEQPSLLDEPDDNVTDKSQHVNGNDGSSSAKLSSEVAHSNGGGKKAADGLEIVGECSVENTIHRTSDNISTHDNTMQQISTGSSLAPSSNNTNHGPDIQATPILSNRKATTEALIKETPKETYVSQGLEHQEQFFTPIHGNTPKPHGRTLGNGLQPELTSPLEALYLFRPPLEEDGEGVEVLNLHGATRNSNCYDADPVGEPPLSPPIQEDDGESPRNSRLEMEASSGSSDESSSSEASTATEGSGGSGGVGKFRIINKDTGSIHDMRVVMKEIKEVGSTIAMDTQYSFLPTRDELEYQRLESTKSLMSTQSEEGDRLTASTNGESFDEISPDSSPTTSTTKSVEPPPLASSMSSVKKKAAKFSNLMASSVATNVRKGVGGLKSSQSKRGRKRATSSEMLPGNAIHVRSSRQNYKASKETPISIGPPSVASPFNPMLLIKTIPKAHEGPAWCAAFSPDGRFLATGGEDGAVLIWAVAPLSKNMHPDGVRSHESDSTPETSNATDDGSLGNESNSQISLEKSESEESSANETGGEKSAPSLTFVGNGPELATNLQIISSEPIRRYKDHTADVIDLSWSHSNFLLSASLDSSVRLYHFSKSGCLHLFKHASLVASCAFHPTDDRYFISGGIDKKLRLWSIPDGRVKEWAQAPDVITATRFTPDGKYAVAGLFRGQVYFYNVDGLIYYTQIACRNRSGKHRMGKKVTGISFVRGERDDWLQAKRNLLPPKTEESSNSSSAQTSTNAHNDSTSPTSGDPTSPRSRLSDSGHQVAKKLMSAFGSHRPEALRYTERMLVSTNDSRVRLFGLNDFCLVRKYKGHTNSSMQIRARISESGEFIASGSESGHVFIWNTLDKNRLPKNTTNVKVHQTQDKTKSSDYFEATKAPLPIVTDSVFFPAKSMKEALVSSSIFPFSMGMDRVKDDFSSAAILSLDYDGTMRVFLRKSCIDALLNVYQGTMA